MGGRRRRAAREHGGLPAARTELPPAHAQRHRSVNDSLKVYGYNGDGSLGSRQIMQNGSVPTCTFDPNIGWYCPNTNQVASSEIYNYDAAGNLMNGVTQLDAGNRLRVISGCNLSYDADGNLVKKTGSSCGAALDTLIWSAVGQLTSVTANGTTVSFGYDGFGRRVRKTVGATATRYLHDGDDLFMELNNDGSVAAEYAFWPGIDQPHSVSRAGQTYYFAMEPVSRSVHGLVRAADNVVVAQYGFTPFGQLEGGSFDNVGNALRFAGREYDAETALYSLRGRYYDPLIGRFISEDPSGLEGGVNLYSYAGNDPVNAADPTGLKLCEWQEATVTMTLNGVSYSETTYHLRCGGSDMPGGALSYYDPGDQYWNTNRNLLSGGLLEEELFEKLLGDAAAVLHSHHLLPRQFRSWFEAAGRELNIEKFKVPIPDWLHTKNPLGIHTKLGGDWNAKWAEWIGKNPSATAEEVTARLGQMVEEFPYLWRYLKYLRL